MGKKRGWFSAVKKALSSDSRDKKDQLKNTKSKKWFGKEKESDCPPSSEREPVAPPPNPVLPPPPQQAEETSSIGVTESDLIPAAVNTETATEEVQRNESRYSGKSKEEIAAIKLQAVVRGFLARRALRALRGLERLKSLIEGQSIKRQSETTLKCMQNLAHLQSEIRARRIRMSEENQALHRQIQQKHEKELEGLRMGKEWNDSTQSKEQVKATLQNKQDAAMRRERALAYSFSHQTKKNARSMNPTFMDPNNPHWGWSWMERWMSSRPWETRSAGVNVMDNNKDVNDQASSKSTVSRSLSVATTKPSPTSSQKAGRLPSRQHLSAGPTSSTPGRPAKTGGSSGAHRARRHSIAEAPARDDESLGSSSPVPSYMTPTKSTKSRAKTASPLGASEKGPVKKRLSFPASPSPGIRRHSVSGKMEGNSLKSKQ